MGKLVSDFLYHYRGLVVSVYDGDSIRVDIELGFQCSLNNQSVRLANIDTPELRKEERALGLVAKARVEELILGKEVILLTSKDRACKYGRWLAEVYLPNEDGFVNVNELLINEGLAKRYDGGAR